LSEQSSGTVRVTVEDAARLLGIQQASVRNRIKRGTLASEQDAQGRTFVFLEVDELSRDRSNPAQSRQASGRWKLSLENLGAISAVLAAFAAGVYVLGLVVLWAPIARTPPHDWTTAWYAASLVPRPVVAGYGLAPLAFPVAISLWLLLTYSSINFARFTANKYLPGHENVEAVLVVLSILVFSVALPTGLAMTLLPTERSAAERIVAYKTNLIEPQTGESLFGFLPQGLAMVAFLLVLWGLATPLFLLLIRAHSILVRSTWNAMSSSGESFLPNVSDWGLFARGFAIYFAVMFVPAFLWALTGAQPRLPSVEVTTQGKIAGSVVDKKFNGHPTFEGRLLTHTDSFWYIFDSNGGKIGKLMSIPDDRVYRIRTPSD
jgi:hypothetical protein